MKTGYILINTIPNKEHKVYNNLKKNSKIREIHPLFKEFDLIAKFDYENRDALNYFVSGKIRKISGVLDTKILY